ncbi:MULTISPECIES: acyl-CoA thioesterase [Microbacterium]|uniref:Thioesterase n=1 Tax=Microbacterium binotii TaxID=462710 RepID=A0ABN3PLB4_9MICO|nr:MULTISPECIES: acyl-CoA thioesterase [unclassified Microbacterium]MDQ1204713.1 acyl-CoA thioesterase FadM [Microbacterium sp. SORGH_AS_0862]MDY0829940.1 acyl-CoA thioesterase [Microbacterium sp. BG28]QCQ17846.1 acyl-CoA thioesterase [Microbacterium sp. RG1]
MNVIWRTLLLLASSRRRYRREGAMDSLGVGRIRLTTLPTDLDVVGHMNNGRYLSLFDLGRFDLLMRTGLWDLMRERGWYPVVANATISYRKSLHLWQRFDVESRVIAADDRAVYLEHRAVVDGEIYAQLIARGRFVRRSGGTVGLAELFEALGQDPATVPAPEEWMLRWAEDVALPSTRRPAPSIWR